MPVPVHEQTFELVPATSLHESDVELHVDALVQVVTHFFETG